MIVDIEKNKQLSARDNRGIKASSLPPKSPCISDGIELVHVRVNIHEDQSAQYKGTLNVSFPHAEGAASFQVPLRLTVEELAGWKKLNLWGSKLGSLTIIASVGDWLTPTGITAKWSRGSSNDPKFAPILRLRVPPIPRHAVKLVMHPHRPHGRVRSITWI